jgi:hypothetical protein
MPAILSAVSCHFHENSYLEEILETSKVKVKISLLQAVETHRVARG